MSCFSGSFSSLPGVRCDRFDCLKSEGNVVAADQFFLSHVHSEHMIGLDSLALFCRKKSYGTRINNKLYCSQISKEFVLKKFPLFPEKTIVGLIPNEPRTIHVYDSCDIFKLRATAIPSNHCPGSLMFLFERLDAEGEVCKRILYTGDFRFDNPLLPLTSLRSLHDRSIPLDIDEIYLDTSYCSPQYLTFPTRQESEEKIWELCQKWIKKNGMFKDTRSKHVILFHLPPRYGYESILQHVHIKSLNKWQVHVNLPNFSEHLCTSAVASCTDSDPNNAQWIHACQRNHEKRSVNQPLLKSLPCQAGDFEVCQIKPSTMYFTQSKMSGLEAAGQDRLVSVSQGGSNYRVCYSTHSSMTELERFVRHFRPLQITPCAIPPNSTKEEVRDILTTFLQSPENNDQITIANPVPPAMFQQDDVDCFTENERTAPGVRMDTVSLDRKRKLSSFEGSFSRTDSHSSTSQSFQPSQPKLLKLERCKSSTKISFDDTMDIGRVGKMVQGEPDSSDEEEGADRYRVEIIPGLSEPGIPPTPAIQPTSRIDKRKMFARSKSVKNCYSMPVPNDPELVSMSKERRKSMPSNMKMPIIKVTPSSPSPDPNHPDYPEFFEDKLYLEHVSKTTKDNESDKKSEIEKEVSFDSFTLVLDPDDSDDEDIVMAENITLTPDKSAREMRRQHSIYDSSLDVEKDGKPASSLSRNISHSISIEIVETPGSVSNSQDH